MNYLGRLFMTVNSLTPGPYSTIEHFYLDLDHFAVYFKSEKIHTYSLKCLEHPQKKSEWDLLWFYCYNYFVYNYVRISISTSIILCKLQCPCLQKLESPIYST